MRAKKDKLVYYLDLVHGTIAMWHVDLTIIVMIVVSVSGLIANSFDRHLKELLLSSSVKGLVQ